MALASQSRIIHNLLQLGKREREYNDEIVKKIVIVEVELMSTLKIFY